MKRFSFLILSLAAAIFQKTQAQSNYLNGYILKSEKDTIFGIIENKNYFDNSKFCDFKTSNAESITRFYPENTYGYRFSNGKYYVSKNVDLDGKQVKLFMEYLIHGKLDIYFVQDIKNFNHYFASKDSLPLIELKYSEQTITDDGVQKIRESKQYIGLLNYFTGDCPSIKDEIPKLNEPDHKKLIHFAEKYHNLTCTDEKCIVYEKKLPRKIKLNIGGGQTYLYSNNDFVLKQGFVPDYGFNLLFQQSQRNEGVYLGIGLYRLPGFNGILIDDFQIPLSVNYYKIKMGFSPLLTYEFDLNGAFVVQALKLGLNYQLKSISFFLLADIKTLAIIKPYGTSINVGLNFDLRK
jgi:hypothetical protein